ncbi:hypothetical protein SVIOM74S_08147 [Streptomyces violarus]
MRWLTCTASYGDSGRARSRRPRRVRTTVATVDCGGRADDGKDITVDGKVTHAVDGACVRGNITAKVDGKVWFEVDGLGDCNSTSASPVGGGPTNGQPGATVTVTVTQTIWCPDYRPAPPWTGVLGASRATPDAPDPHTELERYDLAQQRDPAPRLRRRPLRGQRRRQAGAAVDRRPAQGRAQRPAGLRRRGQRHQHHRRPGAGPADRRPGRRVAPDVRRDRPHHAGPLLAARHERRRLGRRARPLPARPGPHRHPRRPRRPPLGGARRTRHLARLRHPARRPRLRRPAGPARRRPLPPRGRHLARRPRAALGDLRPRGPFPARRARGRRARRGRDPRGRRPARGPGHRALDRCWSAPRASRSS